MVGHIQAIWVERMFLNPDLSGLPTPNPVGVNHLIY